MLAHKAEEEGIAAMETMAGLRARQLRRYSRVR
jgi:pyruvate/2-oxoglutarate dehydrogenase complex dihydrolipoamide dehydrogenase (E3) component